MLVKELKEIIKDLPDNMPIGFVEYPLYMINNIVVFNMYLRKDINMKAYFVKEHKDIVDRDIFIISPENKIF